MFLNGQLTADAPEIAAKGFAETLPEAKPENLRDLWRQIGQFGLFQLTKPSEQSGGECSAQVFIRRMVAFGEGCRDSGLAMAVNSQLWTIQQPLIRFGDTHQQCKYIPGLLSGEKFAAFALTEAAAGSDAFSVQTRAEPVEDGYVLNGEKVFVGMGPVCDMAIVFATTAPEKGRWGLSAFLVEASDTGFVRGRPQRKAGLNTVPMGKLEFRDCFVPKSRRLGPEGAGAAIIQAALDWERCFILTSQVGAMRRQLSACTDYAAERTVFGQRIAEFQSVSNRLADMRVRLETCELMLMKAAELYDKGQPLSQFAAMANLHISEAFLASSMDAMRNFGGLGYLAGSASTSDINDALGGVIYSGTSDIQRQIIANMEIGRIPRTARTGALKDDI